MYKFVTFLTESFEKNRQSSNFSATTTTTTEKSKNVRLNNSKSLLESFFGV